MSYTAEVYNVMIASPSDVNEEREIARETILDWNNINSMTRKIVLMPLGWEYNTSPDMGKSPQDIINKQVLEDADLLVGIFWTRIGTPTGRAISGTVEEIEEHINSGKPTMLYFSSKPIPPDNIDNEQYEAVKKIKKEYQSRGLTENFRSAEDFKTKFQRQLSLKINKDNHFQIPFLESLISNSNEFREPDLAEILSKESKTLLIEVSKDISGEITKLSHVGGLSIHTNGKEITRGSNPRTIALWEAAIEELENNDLIKAQGYQGQIFQITKTGYELADRLTE
jgi:hypothetical protein